MIGLVFTPLYQELYAIELIGKAKYDDETTHKKERFFFLLLYY